MTIAPPACQLSSVILLMERPDCQKAKCPLYGFPFALSFTSTLIFDFAAGWLPTSVQFIALSFPPALNSTRREVLQFLSSYHAELRFLLIDLLIIILLLYSLCWTGYDSPTHFYPPHIFSTITFYIIKTLTVLILSCPWHWLHLFSLLRLHPSSHSLELTFPKWDQFDLIFP